MSDERQHHHVIQLEARNVGALKSVRLRMPPGRTTIKGKKGAGKSTLVGLPELLMGGA